MMPLLAQPQLPVNAPLSCSIAPPPSALPEVLPHQIWSDMPLELRSQIIQFLAGLICNVLAAQPVTASTED
jgi:hypothetical protein